MILLGEDLAGKAAVIMHHELAAGKLTYTAHFNGRMLSPHKITLSARDAVTVEFAGLTVEDFFSLKDGYLLVRRRWTLTRPGRWQFAFNFIPGEAHYTDLIIPSLMYHDNRPGQGKFPRGGLEAGWSFREDRMPIPACAILHDDKRYCLAFSQPARGESDICSIRAYQIGAEQALEIGIPFTEAPLCYCEKGILLGGQRKPRKRYFNVKNQDLPMVYERNFYLQRGEYTANVFRLFTGLAAFAIKEFSIDCLQPPADWGSIASLKLHHLLFLTVDDDKLGICAIQQGKGNPWYVQHAHENVCGSFLTRGMEAACIYARVGAELKSDRLLGLAERIGRFFLQGALDNGLHQDFYKYSEKKMSGYHMPLDAITAEMRHGANARSNGETMVNYLRLYRILQKAGREIAEFVDVARKNADFYIAHQLDGSQAGSFGRWWGRDGRPINTNGTNGAHIISVLVELEKVLGKSEAVDRALDLAADYYASLVRRNQYYGDTLDADCTDKEAGIVLLRAFLDLYERNRDKRYLELAEDAASFVLSWTWTYDVPFGPGTPLGRNNFSTKGMTAVSVAHHHLDFFGLYPAYDFLRIWEATGEKAWKDHAMAMINACAQLVSSPADLLDRSNEFIGYQPEKLNQTDWNYLLLELGGKGHWDTCIAWVVVLTLGAMLDIRERFPGVLSFSFDTTLLRHLDPSAF